MLSLSVTPCIYENICIEGGYRWIGNLPTEEISFNPLGDAHINKSKDSYDGLFIGLKFTWGKYHEDD